MMNDDDLDYDDDDDHEYDDRKLPFILHHVFHMLHDY